MARGALVRLQARDGFRTSDNEPSLACRASASIPGCVRKSLLRLRPSAYLTRDHRLGLATALRQKNACRRNTPSASAHGTLGSWGKATHARRSLRGKARLLPRAASTIRVTMLRRRDTASSPRSRLVSHHANRSLAVPLRMLLARVALPRPSAKARFSS